MCHLLEIEMLDDVLIPESTIDELERRHPIPNLDYVYDPGDPRWGTALRHAMTLAYAPVSTTRAYQISDPVRFYSRYYWWRMFERLVEFHCGQDGLLARQGLELLEIAPEGVDWNILQEIHDRLDARFGKSRPE
jgi:hypothetical protein